MEYTEEEELENECEDARDIGCPAPLTVRDWFDIIGLALYRMGVTAIGFGLVVLSAAALCRWVLIPILRSKGWAV